MIIYNTILKHFDSPDNVQRNCTTHYSGNGQARYTKKIQSRINANKMPIRNKRSKLK